MLLFEIECLCLFYISNMLIKFLESEQTTACNTEVAQKINVKTLLK